MAKVIAKDMPQTDFLGIMVLVWFLLKALHNQFLNHLSSLYGFIV